MQKSVHYSIETYFGFVFNFTVFLSNLSHQRDSAVPHRTAPQRTAPHRIMLYVTVFLKNTIVTLFVTFTVTFIVTFYPVTRTVTPIVTLNCNGKYTVTPTLKP